MAKKLFCERSPLCYSLSVAKGIALRDLSDIVSDVIFADNAILGVLPVKLYSHRSLLMRTLGGVDLSLQKNKVVNLSLAAPKVDHIVIHPGETFSFWRLVGSCTREKGYLDGLVIGTGGKPGADVGGGMCQLTNLIHWLVLHSPLDVVEHHHHDYDLFPDYGRSAPFGTGTSIFYNYVDYRFRNNTDQSFQLILWLDSTHLNGELRCEEPLPYKFHIKELDHYFEREGGSYYRHNRIIRNQIDSATGNTLKSETIIENHSKVLYSPEFIPGDLLV